MNENVQTLDYGVSSLAERNKVLRNTYWLLALSLLPTVLGAYIGVTTGITAKLTGFMGMIVFMAGAFGFIYAIEKNQKLSAGCTRAARLYFLHGTDAVPDDWHGAGL